MSLQELVELSTISNSSTLRFNPHGARILQVLCWLLSISVLKKSAHVDSTGSFSLLSPHQIDDVRVSRMTVYFLIVERICSVASTILHQSLKRTHFSERMI